ncbi:MAG TPA: hypothetical protein PLP23_15910 [Panacibacter sp.]|nr:hypothetical protein [Panacibacter sp.]
MSCKYKLNDNEKNYKNEIINSFKYCIDKRNLEVYDPMIISYYDGTSMPFTKTMLHTLRQNGGKRQMLLSYLRLISSFFPEIFV